MNERIKELWENCEDIQVVYPRQGSPIYASPELLEKFAELIIAKCIDQCKKHDHEPSVDKKSNEVDYAESRTARHCADSIRWYFGVEE